MDVQNLIANLFFVAGLIATIACTIWLLVRMYEVRSYVRTTAEIISLKKGEIKVSSIYPPIKTETPILRYIVDGKTIESANLQPALEEEHRFVVGNNIAILYHPSKPHKHCYADNFQRRHYAPVTGILLGISFVILGIIFRFILV